MPIPEPLSQVARDSLILWAGKYLKTPEKRKIVAEELKMSAIHIRPLEEELRDAIIDGEIMRAEKRAEKRGREEGKEIGKEIGEEKIIKTLLEKYDAKQISEMIGMDIEKIKEIESK